MNDTVLISREPVINTLRATTENRLFVHALFDARALLSSIQ